MKIDTHLYYNILLPVERVLTLFIYLSNESSKSKKYVHSLGILLVLTISIGSLFYYGNLDRLHDISNISTGLILALLSYFHLRSISLSEAGQSRIIFYFGLANMIYFALMITAMSGLPLAMKVGNEFASKIYNINLFAYSIWSAILILGILWKKQKI